MQLLRLGRGPTACILTDSEMEEPMKDGSLWRRFWGVAVALLAAAWVAGSVGGALAAADGGMGHSMRDGGHGGHRDGGVQDGGSGLKGNRDTRTSISWAD